MHYFMELRQGLQLAATWRKMEREGERERGTSVWETRRMHYVFIALLT